MRKDRPRPVFSLLFSASLRYNGAMWDLLIQFFQNENVRMVLLFLYKTWFIWLPAGTLAIVWELWVRYVRGLFFASQKYALLEIKLPRELYKSPKAAEFFIANLYQTSGEKNWFEKYWQGKVRAWFSLEMVSIGGTIHFYVWTRSGFKNLIESNLYSQYPGIEVYEVPDYTLPVSYDPATTSMWASEFELTKPDVFPIKTYVDYGMDKDPKEEFKIDPMTPLIEFLGSLPRENQVWLQIIVRAHKAEDKDPKGGGKLVDLRWAKAADEEIDKIVAKAKGEKDGEGKLIPGSGRQLTDLERETINALGRSVSKSGFDVGMRAIYIAPKESYSPANISGITGGIAHFNSHLNGFRPARGSEERYGNFLLAWKLRSPKKRDAERQKMLDAYKRRAYYYVPFKSPHFVLNTEELATMFHFPGGVAATPTFNRIESRKAEAPTNLPV
jgi:hypothetical protein